MPSDVFRPKLPLDPFGPQPWRVAPLQASSARPQEVILMLGAPSHADLAPLATSPLLSNSLLIIATHTPPPIPKPTTSSSGPSIIVLRLPEPLHIHESGAIRLVNLLDRASRVAHSWRTALLQQPRIQQLAELFPGGEFSISEEPELAAVPHHQPRPPPQPRHPLSSSSGSDREEHSDSESVSTISSTASSSSSRFSHRSSYKQAKANSKNATGQAQFSALINFLPPGLPDKALLKHSVLVTTLAAPFLAPPASTSPYGGSTNKKRNRQSVLSSLSFTSLIGSSPPANRSRSRLSSLFANPPSAYDQSKSSPPSLRVSPSVESLVANKIQGDIQRPHLIHVLPYSAAVRTSFLPLPPSHPLSQEKRRSRTYDSGPHPQSLRPGSSSKGKERAYESFGPSSKSKLVQSIEQFLLSYAYPPSTSTSSSAPSLPLAPGVPGSGGLNDGSTLSPSSPPKPNPQLARRSFINQAPGGTPSISISQAPGSLDNGQAIVPYVLAAGVLGSFPSSIANPTQQPLTIGELLLQGVMDKIAAGGAGADEDEPAFGGNVAQVNWPRAWIGRGGEVEMVLPNSDAYGTQGGKQPFHAGGLPVPAHPLSVVNSDSVEPVGVPSTGFGAMVNSPVSPGSGSSVIRSSPLSSGATTPVHDEPLEMEIAPNPKRKSQLPFGGVAIPRFGSGSKLSSAEKHGFVSSSAPSSYVPPPPTPASEKPAGGKGKGKTKQKREISLPTPPDSSSSLDGTSSEGSSRSRSSSSGEHADSEVEAARDASSRMDDNLATPIAAKFIRGRTTSATTPVNGRFGLPTPGPSREPSTARSESGHGRAVHVQKEKKGLKGKLTSLFGGRAKKNVAASAR